MKTSNKIILAILLISFGFLISAHMVLRQKYLQKDFMVTGKNGSDFYDEYNIPPVHYLSLKGLSECHIIPADALKISIEKGPFHQTRYHVLNDTLFIYGSYEAQYSSALRVGRAPEKITLFIPQMDSITASNSNIDIKGSNEFSKHRVYHFNLDNSNLFSRWFFWGDSINRHFDSVFIKAKNNSQVILFHNDSFKMLQVTLNNSLFDDRKARTGEFLMSADSSSTIITGGKGYSSLVRIP